MKRKLELKDIYGYLPYKLKVLYEHSDTATIESINTEGVIQLCEKGDWRKYHILKEIERCKPILRPISDLYKTITHDGKEIVPIVECAKMQTSFAWTHDDESCEASTERFAFFYMGDFHFRFRENGEDNRLHICNQHELFDYLHELKIDYRGLIDSGLAIDANTLENNPYKF
jgi:hypothetical protein